MKLTQNIKEYYYLALGDSYTIGEQVPPTGNFPNQVCSILKGYNINMHDPRIIAKTGWTTDELESGIREAKVIESFRDQYDLVTLLIGVNNQYRGRSTDNYKMEFEALLKKAILFSGEMKERLLVLSIPDWGVTPFAEGRDRKQIAKEIDAYNAVNEMVCLQKGIQYINITPWTREAATDLSLLAPDGLHPSVMEYSRWAKEIASHFISKI